MLFSFSALTLLVIATDRKGIRLVKILHSTVTTATRTVASVNSLPPPSLSLSLSHLLLTAVYFSSPEIPARLNASPQENLWRDPLPHMQPIVSKH